MALRQRGNITIQTLGDSDLAYLREYDSDHSIVLRHVGDGHYELWTLTSFGQDFVLEHTNGQWYEYVKELTEAEVLALP